MNAGAESVPVRLAEDVPLRASREVLRCTRKILQANASIIGGVADHKGLLRAIDEFQADARDRGPATLTGVTLKH